jgi:colicin import membrane protein
MEEEDKCKSDVTGVGLLRSIMWDAAEIPTFGPASLNDFRPYVLRNTQQAIIDIGGVELFHGVASWEVFSSVLEDEFAPQIIQNMYYSTKASPTEFPYLLKQPLFDDLKRMWQLEKVVARNNRVRQYEAIQQAKEDARQKQAAAERAAARAEERAAKKAAKKAEAKAAGEAYESEEEEPDEGDPEPKLSRKEREALEKEQKQQKKDEKERTKRETQEDYEMKTLQVKLARLVDVAYISLQFKQ